MCLISTTDLSQCLVHDGDAVRVVDVEAKAEVHFLLFVVVVLAGDVINLEELWCASKLDSKLKSLYGVTILVKKPPVDLDLGCSAILPRQ